MIVVKLMGGLGNQMFQYATGYTVAKRHNVPLKLDASFLNQDPNGAWTKRTFELSVFGIELTEPTKQELDQFLVQAGRLKRMIHKFLPNHSKYHYLAEKGQGFLELHHSFTANTYLEGFWQNEKYFLEQRHALIKLFQPQLPKPNVILNLSEIIQANLTVSLHVRHGDYLTQPGASEFHGVCDMNYYTKAIEWMSQKLGPFHLIIFSDDPTWCKKHFNHPFEQTIVEHKEHAVWDLFLMSNCQHHIIANSSFSWWGAWLNPNRNKLVVMPKQWFKAQTADEIDINPSHWIML